MTRKNKKALFKLSPIACALALSFAFGAAPAVHAYERESSSSTFLAGGIEAQWRF